MRDAERASTDRWEYKVESQPRTKRWKKPRASFESHQSWMTKNEKFSQIRIFHFFLLSNFSQSFSSKPKYRPRSLGKGRRGRFKPEKAFMTLMRTRLSVTRQKKEQITRPIIAREFQVASLDRWIIRDFRICGGAMLRSLFFPRIKHVYSQAKLWFVQNFSTWRYYKNLQKNQSY